MRYEREEITGLVEHILCAGSAQARIATPGYDGPMEAFTFADVEHVVDAEAWLLDESRESVSQVVAAMLLKDGRYAYGEAKFMHDLGATTVRGWSGRRHDVSQVYVAFAWSLADLVRWLAMEQRSELTRLESALASGLFP